MSIHPIVYPAIPDRVARGARADPSRHWARGNHAQVA
uniref:Uncharacterized protein n=1 Tax=Anguilla anguilla TaxID=7936 RepID=A0A0E9V4J6_ANGAN